MKVLRGAFGAALRTRWSLAVISCVACGLAGPGVAQAALTPGYGWVGSFGSPGSAQGELNTPQRVAVDDASGNVLIADSANARVQVFSPSGAAASYLTEFSTGLTSPYGIAVDQSDGSVYISDPGAGAIVKFATDGQPTPTYTVDNTFTSPASGSATGDVGSFSAPLAVDPTTHDLLVADPANGLISRYTSSGVFVRSFNGSTSSGGAFTGLEDVSTDGSTIYVTDSAGDPIFGGTARIERFDASGASLGADAPADKVLLAVADPNHGTVDAVSKSGFDALPELSVFTGSGELGTQSAFSPAIATTHPNGVAVTGGGRKRLYVVADTFFGVGDPSVQVFAPAPGVALDPVASPGMRSAHITGTVNPDGNATRAHFEYSDDGGSSWGRSTAPQTLAAVSTDVPVIEDITGLRPNTDYQIRLVADNGTVTATSSVQSFHTLQAPPDAETADATDQRQDSATLNGYVTPFGLQSTFHFEYGTSTEYGHRVPATGDDVVGNGIVRRVVSEAIKGLSPGTTYHFRIVASSSAGTTDGNDVTFQTDPADSPARAYEMVSPVDKGGSDVASYPVGAQARADGGAVVYTTTAAFPGSDGSPVSPRYSSVRTSTGWVTRPTDPPLAAPADGTHLFWSTLAVSDDQTKALVVTRRALATGAVEGNMNMYVRTLGTDQYQLVATSADSVFKTLGDVGSQWGFIGATPNFSKIVFNSATALTPDAVDFYQGKIYEWSASGGLRLGSVMPDSSANTGSAQDATSGPSALNEVSAVGESYLFGIAGGGADDGLYLRDNGHTVAISVSQRTGDPAVIHPAAFLGRSRDDKYVSFLATDNSALTDAAPVAPNNIYRYDVQTGALTYLATGGSNALVFGTSDDQSRVYFKSDQPQTGGSVGPGPWLYAADLTGVTLIAAVPPTVDSNPTPGYPATSAVSPSGRYFAFQSTAPLLGYDNSGSTQCAASRTEVGQVSDVCYEVYRYDADESQLVCLSCRRDGRTSTGDASLGIEGQPYLSRYFARPVLDDGTVFFDSPEPLVTADVNGRRDVYEYRSGVTRLISPGTADSAASLQDVTPDGNDVFFTTDERLVAGDKDTTVDMYDARVGGGFASQNDRPIVQACSGLECSEPSSGPTTSPPAPTQGAARAPARPSAPAARARVSIVSVARSSTQLTVKVRVSGRGRIRVSGTRVTATVRSVAAAGIYTIKVPLTRSTRTAVRAHKKVKVAFRVSLTPPFAKQVHVSASRTLGK